MGAAKKLRSRSSGDRLVSRLFAHHGELFVFVDFFEKSFILEFFQPAHINDPLGLDRRGFGILLGHAKTRGCAPVPKDIPAC
jgi:hypothetical protein